jgi:hypothetical protein
MAASLPTSFRDDSQLRSAEVPAASWTNGMNWAASNAPGIGINMGQGPVVGTPEQFTLLDQYGAARTPQISAQIGHEDEDSIRFGANSSTGDGSMPGPNQNCALESLAAGWTAPT